ncbi:flagellar assembly protein A [Sulfurimonas sp.]|uniref:flagellar assembly protein A n=1 Tax=Sulfurimonas sp. TaxID=2022749 RepID=UPI0025D07019|nr:flagellar assembly protein A [Sulfurimonas sp.]MDD5157156.1 FapA family protein [Sulfurimonas sp.]
MGLFEKNDNVIQKPITVHPTIIKTQFVAKEIAELAKRHNISPNTLDFKILEVETYTRTNKEKSEADWELIDDEMLHKISDDAEILNKNFQIKQIYEVKIFLRENDSIFKNFNSAVGANATKCKIYLSIKAGSKIKVDKTFEKEFVDYINKSKVRAGILIYVFDKMLKELVLKISAQAKVDGTLSYDKSITLLIAESHEPVATIHDNLIFHYKKDTTQPINGAIDYSKRGFINGVGEGNLLIEYIKPKKGQPGRNCSGEFLDPMEPFVRYAPSFGVDDTISVIEKADTIEYVAKKSGYIVLENGVYQIKSDLQVNTIDFKTTGSIVSGLDSDIALNVKESDFEKDAIGEGMEVEVNQIDVEGNIGARVKVRARRATINGQTHKTSEVNADELTITVHKGLAVGKNIKIGRLESGEVRGRMVSIGQAVGGDIRGQEIEISLCGSHVKATASKLIEIKKLQGSENIFTIDPLVHKEKEELFSENMDNIDELGKETKEIAKEIVKYEKLVKDNTAAFNEIRKKLIHYQQNKIAMPASFVDKYKQFQKIQEHLELIKKEYIEKQERFKYLTMKIASFQESIFEARIINRDKWNGYNELIFKLVSPSIDIVYKPFEGSTEQIFALVETEEGTFEIKPVHE